MYLFRKAAARGRKDLFLDYLHNRGAWETVFYRVWRELLDAVLFGDRKGCSETGVSEDAKMRAAKGRKYEMGGIGLWVWSTWIVFGQFGMGRILIGRDG